MNMGALFPSGKRKHVEAQGMDYNNLDNGSMFQPNTPGEKTPSSQGFKDQTGMMEQDKAFDDPRQLDSPEDKTPSGFNLDKIQDKPKQESESDADILGYVIKKLQSFGYPPRRLTEFKDEFVSEKLLPGSARDISLVLPDRYYGHADTRLKSSDVSGIIDEVQAKFGLNFKDGERKDKKVFLNFVTRQGEPGEDGEEEVMGDDLEEIFNGGAVEKPKKKKVAQTQSEMMKSAMQLAFEKINEKRK